MPTQSWRAFSVPVANSDWELIREGPCAVMGAVSRNGPRHSRIGSTAGGDSDVTCDVLVVKPRLSKTAVSRKRTKLPI